MTARVGAALLVGAVLSGAWSPAWGLEFSADQTVKTGTQSVTGKIYFKADRWRIEIAGPDGPRVSIHRMDRIVTWLLLPNKTYVELPLRYDQIPQLGKVSGETDRKQIGSERVGGRKTKKYEVTVETNGRKVVLYQWVATDLKIPMKTATPDGRLETTFTNVIEGPQPAALFELPAGYTKATAKP